MTILKEFFGLLWTIAVVAFLIGLAVGVYLGVKAGIAMDAAGYTEMSAVAWIGGGRDV